MASSDAAPAAAILRTETLAPESDGGGLVKEVVREGTGALPARGEHITAHYTGRLLDGTVFDSSVTRGTPFTFTIGQGQVIKGWDEGFATMRVGEKAFLTCGSGYAYGASGSPPTIPPGATLRFEAELIAAEPVAQKGMAAARAARESGKAAFAGGDARGAAEAWDEGWRAIEYNVVEDGPLGDELRQLKVALRSNSALAYFKLKDFGLSRTAAEDAYGVDPTCVKAHFRAAAAALELGDVDASKAAALAALKLDPGLADAKKLLADIKAKEAASNEKEAKLFKGMFASKPKAVAAAAPPVGPPAAPAQE